MAEYEETEENNVEDQTDSDDTVVAFQYDITSFGADYDVEGLVKRLNRGDIFVPHFQREYVWNIAEASRFVESLLLGLPVPGIFLAREAESNKLIVIDGQQRLKTLQFFYNGFFNPHPDDKRKRIFKLFNVQNRFEGIAHEDLDEEDRIFLDNSIIHATIVKQENPKNDSSSIYHVFERLNTGGRKLEPQEIRSAIYHGSFLERIEKINKNELWRKNFGKPHSRLKDRELILRFFAFYSSWRQYSRPMKEFLNIFLATYRNPSDEFLLGCENLFNSCIEIIFSSIGNKAFRTGKSSINAAVFDSVTVGVATRLTSDSRPVDTAKLRMLYAVLLTDSEYISFISKSPASESSVFGRMRKATEAFQLI